MKINKKDLDKAIDLIRIKNCLLLKVTNQQFYAVFEALGYEVVSNE